jgi:hypothetical protein
MIAQLEAVEQDGKSRVNLCHHPVGPHRQAVDASRISLQDGSGNAREDGFCDNTLLMQPDNLISLKDDMIAFIAGHGMRRLNGYVSEEVPTVLFEEDDIDAWKDFVEHAKAAGCPFVTMSEVVLEKFDVAILLEQLRDQSYPDDEGQEFDDAQSLVKHVGKTGYLQLGFAHQGVMFLFETSTEWYDRFQEILEAVTDLGGIVVDDRDGED